MDADACTKIFEKIPISSFPQTPKGAVKLIRSDMTVREACMLLHNEKILSAPVVDVSQPDTAKWNEKFVAVLDLLELVVFMLESMDQDATIQEEDEDASEENTKPFDYLPSEFANRHVSSLTEDETPGWMPFMPIEDTSSLFDAIVLLGTYRMKRLPVIKENGGSEVINIITQSAMLHQIHSMIDQLPLAEKSLKEVGLADEQDVHSVNATDSVKKAFGLMKEHSISAVPVIGVDGKLVGNISASHVYHVIVAVNKARVLEQTCTQFLATTAAPAGSADIMSNVITCKADQLLKEVIAKLDAAKIHRIYLLDDEGKPRRVISLCDVLAKFSVEPEGTCTIL